MGRPDQDRRAGTRPSSSVPVVKLNTRLPPLTAMDRVPQLTIGVNGAPASNGGQNGAGKPERPWYSESHSHLLR